MAEYQSMLRKCCGWIVFVLLFAAIFGSKTIYVFLTLTASAVAVVLAWALLSLAGRKFR